MSIEVNHHGTKHVENEEHAGMVLSKSLFDFMAEMDAMARCDPSFDPRLNLDHVNTAITPSDSRKDHKPTSCSVEDRPCTPAIIVWISRWWLQPI